MHAFSRMRNGLRPLRMLTYGKFDNLSYLYFPKTTKVVQDIRSGSEQRRKCLIIEVVDGISYHIVNVLKIAIFLGVGVGGMITPMTKIHVMF